MNVLQHFILIYDHAVGKLIDIEEFRTNSEAATKRYSEIEKEYRNSARMDIVLVGSDSIETVKITHSKYFDDGHSRIRDFMEIPLSFA